MRVLAIAPGYERIGIAVIKKERVGEEVLLYSDCFRTKKNKTFDSRLLSIGEEITKIIKKYKPDVLSIETLYFNTNQKTALQVAEVRGMIKYISTAYGLSVFEYTPLQVKNAVVGYGKGTKEQVAYMVKQLITIKKNIRLDDEYDAIAIGLTCCASVHKF